MLIIISMVILDVTAATDRYRLSWRDNPSTSMVVGWEQVSGSTPVVYYGTTDHGTDFASYANSQTVSRSESQFGMNHRFARLTGLQPDTVYYFVINDSEGTSPRFWFRTAPDTPQNFSIVAGGDSRNNRTPRQRANTIVSKIRPLFVTFGGDYTNGNTSTEWQEWFDDWQNTISADGRMYPIVCARGNHDDNDSIAKMFDVPSTNIYYALSIGGTQLRVYTLNSEITADGSQGSWLESDLSANTSYTFKMAHYHKPMRPHSGSKSEGNSEYNAWANRFHNYGVDLVVECDSHLVKRTYPVRPSSESGSDEGFIRDDANGTVYIGEGCWGAPLRSANDGKSWTQAMGSFNQVNWIQVHGTDKVEIRTVEVDSSTGASSVSDSNPFVVPSGLSLWNPASGSTVVINSSGSSSNNPPVFNSASYSDNATAGVSYSYSFAGQAIDLDGDNLTYSKQSGPSWLSIASNGIVSGTPGSSNGGVNNFVVLVSDGVGGIDTANYSVTVATQGGAVTISSQISSGDDDVEEHEISGAIYSSSSDIEMVFDTYNSQGNQTVGLRFNNMSIPQGATITDAYVQFTVDEADSGSTNVTITGHDTGNATAFSTAAFDVSNRADTSASIVWNPADWITVGAAGEDQRTPNLQTIIQEIVDRGDWSTGNSIVLKMTGTGTRTAESYDGVPSSAAVLFVEYETSSNLWTEITNDDFEGGLGNWTSGGVDCIYKSGNSAFAASGIYCVEIRDNTSESVMTTDNLSLSSYSEIRVSFSYITRSMDNSDEDFWLQISTDGGSTFTTVADYDQGDEFQNGVRYNEVVNITGFSLNDQTKIRFRCDASGNRDEVFIDDVIIEAK